MGCWPGEVCLCLAQSTEGWPGMREARRRADSKGGFGVALLQKKEMWAGCWDRRCWTARGQHGSILHLMEEKWKKEDERKLPHLSQGQDDGWLVIFCVSAGAAKSESLYWDLGLKTGTLWAVSSLQSWVFSPSLHSFGLFLKLKYCLHIIKFTHFKCRFD